MALAANSRNGWRRYRRGETGSRFEAGAAPATVTDNLATVLLHAAGIAAATGVAALTGKYGHVAARIAGGAFALAGIGVLAGWL